MSCEAAKDHFGEFIKTFNPQSRLTIVPSMDPKLWDRNGAAESFYLGQNKMLCESVVLKVDGLQGLDEFHEDEMAPWQHYGNRSYYKLEDQAQRALAAYCNSTPNAFASSLVNAMKPKRAR
jgi:hypothetical protein